jgi:hypothetical protein
MSYVGENNLPRCPNCQLRTLERRGDDAHCTECGKDFVGAFKDYDGRPPRNSDNGGSKVSVKNKKSKSDGRGGNYKHLPTWQKHRYIEENKDAIIIDLFKIGRAATRAKWFIASSALFTFERKWLTEEQRKKLTKLGISLRKILQRHAETNDHDVAEPPSQPAESEEKVDQKVDTSRRGLNFSRLPANRKHEFIESHKDEIIADLLSFGRPITCSKWNISETTIHVFEKKYLTNEQKDQITKIGMEIGKYISEDGQMPPLPRFKDSWDVSVQVKWLEVYEALNRYSSENMKGGN